jgi:hypothetical protein
MPESVEGWATMPVEELMHTLEVTTLSLAQDIESHALDEGSYQRKFWTMWQHLPEGMTVAAMNRDCELECRVLNEARILSQSIVESRTAKRDAIVAILAARAK